MPLWLHELLNRGANLETKSALKTAARAAAVMRKKTRPAINEAGRVFILPDGVLSIQQSSSS